MDPTIVERRRDAFARHIETLAPPSPELSNRLNELRAASPMQIAAYARANLVPHRDRLADYVSEQFGGPPDEKSILFLKYFISLAD